MTDSISAKIIAHSQTSEGKDIVTFELEYLRSYLRHHRHRIRRHLLLVLRARLASGCGSGAEV